MTKTPDFLLEMDSEKFDAVNRYFAEDTTERGLRDALWQTRRDFGGISLQQVARIIREQFDSVEVDSLVKELTTTNE